MIREIESKDDQIMGTIIQKSLEEQGIAIPGTAYYDPHLFNFSDYYRKNGDKYWVLDIDGEIVGGIGIGPFGSKKGLCELQKMYIKKEAQGNGYSHLLMKTALEYAKAHYGAVYLETFHSLKQANHLYRKYGFEALEESLPETDHSACDAWFLKEFS